MAVAVPVKFCTRIPTVLSPDLPPWVQMQSGVAMTIGSSGVVVAGRRPLANMRSSQPLNCALTRRRVSGVQPPSLLDHQKAPVVPELCAELYQVSGTQAAVARQAHLFRKQLGLAWVRNARCPGFPRPP